MKYHRTKVNVCNFKRKLIVLGLFKAGSFDVLYRGLKPDKAN